MEKKIFFVTEVTLGEMRTSSFMSLFMGSIMLLLLVMALLKISIDESAGELFKYLIKFIHKVMS